ncbi:metallophosphoesterase [Neobacillus ginsengisoli]|uniref:MPP superfamily phosphohydrolase n=1 Tax=Neobacillus ginsengisoli TaxID=904295 RepID=A0ABT9XS72_9BACI|nr:metallophosphoesterase [Neobacillus ginsengisoli]MDQ0198412.1 putative MPP superfamily phosphohydrolase [Neobacillus ginsengisoli]
MSKKITRRSLLKSTLGTLLTVFGMSSGGYFYANRIEPSLLDINELQIKHSLIPKSFDGIKIVQFSDTHLGFQYNINQFKGLIKRINAIQPDLIFFTGDLMDEPNKYREINKIVPILQQLNAPLGQYCIFGNHDHGGYGSELYRNIMQAANFTVLLNESRPIKLRDGSSIFLIGIDDAMLGSPDLDLAQKHVPDNTFKLLLSHAPDLADTASNYQIHWQLSGHSHGGQVKIPFVGALVKPPFARKYPEGIYSIGEIKPLSLYVNRGIGTTRLPFRFMAKPELTVFTLKSENTE